MVFGKERKAIERTANDRFDIIVDAGFVERYSTTDCFVISDATCRVRILLTFLSKLIWLGKAVL